MGATSALQGDTVKRTQLDMRRFEKVVALLDSAVEGEASAAFGRARHLLASAGVSFQELMVGTSVAEGGKFASAQERAQEHQLESLRWSLARQELQIATLRQAVEEKSAVIQKEQEKRFLLERELSGVRKALAVQMEEALNRREEAEKLFRDLSRSRSEALELLREMEQLKSAGNDKKNQDTGALKKDVCFDEQVMVPAPGAVRNGTAGVRPSASSGPNQPVGKNLSSSSSSLSSGSKGQGALDLVGGRDNEGGQQYRWAPVEQRHYTVTATVSRPGNDDPGFEEPGFRVTTPVGTKSARVEA